MNKEFYETLKIISSKLRYSKYTELNKHVTKNISTNSIKSIDIKANNLIVDSIMSNPNIVAYISEEVPYLRYIKTEKEITGLKAPLVFAFDPIDGTNNVDVNITLGTIFCLYELNKETNQLRTIVYSGYILYGFSTIFVEAFNHGVFMFQLNKQNDFGMVKKIHFNLLKKNKKIYALNESKTFINSSLNYVVSRLKEEKYNQRWIGSMVADCHQILMNGGYFFYPGTMEHPKGKLRLLYGIMPMAYIFKMSGGVAVNDRYKNILDLLDMINLKTDIHIRHSVILCSNSDYNHLKYILNY